MITKFFWQTIEQIREGGLPVLLKKIRFSPQWFINTRYGLALAISGCRLAIIIKPGKASAHFRLGKALSQLSRLEEAIVYLRRAVSLKPDWAEAHFQLAKTLVRSGHPTEAGTCLEEVISLKPDWAEAYVQLAEILIKLGHFDKAFSSWDKAFQLQPEWPEVHFEIMNAFFFCGQTSASRSIMQRVLDARNDFARKHQLDKLGIRFLIGFSTAIGHIAVLDSYVKMDILGLRSPTHPILLVDPNVSNPCYLDYWRSYVPDMITDPVALKILLPLARYTEDHMSAVLDSVGEQIVGRNFVAGERLASIQAQWEAEGHDPLIVLRESDHKRGWECLRSLGVPEDAWFVGLHVREGRVRSRGARDADISTYQMAIGSIVARGGWVIRMGDPSMTPLASMPHVIDYAHSEARSDWMDVFLWARCRFFIGTLSGPHNVADTFGVPCALTNWASMLERPWLKQDLYILKLRWSESEARYLNFAEVMSSPLAAADSLDYFASKRIRLVDNTPEEINDVVMEMMDRMEGTLTYSKEDMELQARFDLMCTRYAYKVNARLGREFLRKWSHLL